MLAVVGTPKALVFDGAILSSRSAARPAGREEVAADWAKLASSGRRRQPSSRLLGESACPGTVAGGRRNLVLPSDHLGAPDSRRHLAVVIRVTLALSLGPPCFLLVMKSEKAAAG